eukprot:scaffold36452_cov150-Skeletonema_dohrnii-CCMP3373.AAC.1
MASKAAATLLRHGGKHFFTRYWAAKTKLSSAASFAPSLSSFVPNPSYHSSSRSMSSDVTNGKFMQYSMLYHDSVAFLVSNQLGIPVFMASEPKTPADVAKKFNLSVRAASALLVTLCRMDVVQVVKDSDDSVDDIVYGLTPSAKTFLSNRKDLAC